MDEIIKICARVILFTLFDCENFLSKLLTHLDLIHDKLRPQCNSPSLNHEYSIKWKDFEYLVYTEVEKESISLYNYYHTVQKRDTPGKIEFTA